MKRRPFILIFLLFSFEALSQTPLRCVITTPLGNIHLELYPDKAPVTVNNFLRYVDSGLYINSSFFRVCTPENETNRNSKIEVIQGGYVANEKLFEPIPLETTEETNITHRHGTISMARNSPNSATSDFFICINDQPELDFKGKRNNDGLGFAAFGQVTDGMDVVLKIQQMENKDQYLIEPVPILSITRVQ